MNGKINKYFVIYSTRKILRKKSKIIIDWEHSEYRWIPPLEIIKYKTVPHLKDVVFKLLL